MALDLSALDMDTSSPVASGKALRAPLDMFVPDPEQLDRERDEAADDRDREDIKQRGVMQPIIVGEPLPDGRLPIRTGHRRWRLSGEAGKTDAPYVFEVDGVIYDDYAKLAENRKRKNESPMDIAKLIVKRKAKGEKNKFIADQIGIDPSEITHHLVLIEGPEYIRVLYEQKKCRTPKYLYELEKLSRDFPAQVENFCNTSDEFSYKAIMAFGESLKNLGNTKDDDAPQAPAAQSSAPHANPPAAPSSAQGPAAATPQEGASSATGATSGEGKDDTVWPFPTNSGAAGSAGSGDAQDDAGQASDSQVKQQHIPSHNPENEKDPAAPLLADPSKIRKPLLLGTYNGSDVMVMLYKRPTTPGLVFVKHENGTGEEEVEFGQIKNLTLTESKV